MGWDLILDAEFDWITEAMLRFYWLIFFVPAHMVFVASDEKKSFTQNIKYIYIIL